MHVLSPIGEDVDERMANFAGRSQDARVISVAPDWTPSAQCTIDRACNANSQTLNAVSEVRSSLRLHKQMHVVHLNTEVENTELVRCRHHQRAVYSVERNGFAQ